MLRQRHGLPNVMTEQASAPAAALHRLFAGYERVGDAAFVTLGVQGQLTHDDYAIITPLMEAAAVSAKRTGLNLLFDMSQMTGWEPEALVDDIQLALRVHTRVRKLALVTPHGWQQRLVDVLSKLFPVQVQTFLSKQEAIEWLHAR
jgi:hypothetical protein